MWQRWLVIGLVLLVIGVVVFEESTTPDNVKEPPKQENTQEKQDEGSDANGDEPLPFAETDQQAVFLEGNLKQWIASHVIYPQEAIEMGIEGRIIVRFVIDKKGNVVSPVITKGADPLLDEEVIRMIHTMPRWKPARKNGKPVSSIYNLPVSFKLQ